MSRRSHCVWTVGVLGIAVLASAGMGLGCRALPETATQDAVSQALTSGAYAEAERLATAWSARVEADEGRESLSLARTLDWLVQARLKNGQAGAQDTIALGERALRLKELHLDRNDPDTAVSLHNLGAAHVHRGEFSAGLRLLERALEIRTATFGPDDPVVADSLDQLALALIHLGRFLEAERRLNESQPIRQRRSVDSPLGLARTLELIGLLHRTAGSYAAGVEPIDQALAIRSRLSPDHPDNVTTLQLRGDIHLLMGDISNARRVWSSALNLGERSLRPDHPALAEVLRRLGFAAYSFGNLAEARGLRERALRIGEQSLNPCDPAAAALVNAMGLSLRYDGDYSEARRLYRRALTTVRECLESGRADLTADAEATLVFNDAEVATEVGDFVEADQLHDRAVRIWSSGLGPNHPFVATGLDALAEVVASRGQLSRSRELYERALASRRRSLGPVHPQVAWTLTNMARTVGHMGDVVLALRYVDEAIAIYRKSGAADEPDHFARVLELRGTLEARHGNVTAARASLAQALTERTRIFGESHPLVAESRAALAAVDFARGDTRAALSAALEAERSGREHLLFTVRYLPERQAMTYAAKRPRGLDLALTIAAAGDQHGPTAVLDAVIRSRGVVLDELAARGRASANSSPEIASLVAAVTASRQRFANLVVRSLQETVPRALLDEARKQKEDAERALAERSVEASTELTRAAAGLDDIRRALPQSAALVSFVRYERTRSPTRSPSTRASAPELSYAAFVMRSGSGDVRLVQLGAAARLDPLITAWRNEVSGHSIAGGASLPRAQRLYDEASTRLRQAVWDPVAPHIAGAPRVFVVPDGLLNLVNLAALRDRDGRYLVERESVLHHLTTERDLLLPAQGRAAAQALLAVGGPAFDQRAAGSTAPSTTRASDCQSLAGGHFGGLPGSLSEVAEISAMWPKSSPSEVTLLSGTAATESAVKKAAAGRRIVHLATHGFFLGADCAPGLPGLRAVGGLVPASGAAPVATDNPLLLTGLALAGANNRSSASLDQDDGLLTAEEIAGLNLQGTEWAVLSACDTGLGEIKAGEGVFGLRRAFQIAGARTVIMSLWSVEDESTRGWMRALYEGRLQRRLDTAAAVRDASLAMLQSRRAKGQTTHPFYWAAFVAAGDWR